MSSDYDIIALSETWLHSGVESKELFGDDYSVFRCDRSHLNSTKKRGGGVLIAIKSKFISDSISLVAFQSLEVVVVKVCIKSLTIFIICVYIPSPSPLNIYENFIVGLNSFFSSTKIGANGIILLLGDLNLFCCSWLPHDDFDNVFVPVSSGIFSNFIDNIQSLGLFQINNVLNHMDRLLDLAFVNILNDIQLQPCTFSLVKIDIFHVPFEILIEFPINNTTNNNNDEMYFDLKKTDFKSLNIYFHNTTWDNLFTDSHIDNIVNNLYQVFDVGFELFVKKKKSKSINTVTTLFGLIST